MTDKLASILSTLDLEVLGDFFVRLSHGAFNGEELAQTGASATILILGGLVVRSLIKKYRHNFKFSGTSYFAMSKRVVKAAETNGAWGFASIPALFGDVAALPIYLIVSLLSPRPAEEKELLLEEEVSLANVKSRTRNLNDRQVGLEDRIAELEVIVKELGGELSEALRVTTQIGAKNAAKAKSLGDLRGALEGLGIATYSGTGYPRR